MHKSKKILAFSITIGVVILFALQYIFKNKIIKAIETELPPNIVLNYSQLNTNILMGTIELDSLSFNITHSDKKEFIEINAPRLKIVGIHLWQFIISKSISIKEIIFENPDVHYYQTQKSKGNAEATTSKKQFNKSIKIGTISIKNGSFKVLKRESNELILSIDSINSSLIGLKTDGTILKNKIPFHYKSYRFNMKHFFMNTSAYDFLEIETLNAEGGNLKLQNVSFKPKFTKQELSAKIAYERDHIQLDIPNLELFELDLDLSKEKLFFTAKNTKLINPKLDVYRDKRVTDDSTIKSMYSKMLRDLSFKFILTDIKLKRGNISYSEKVENTDKAGEIFFDNVNASIINLSNTENSKLTSISASSEFMGKAKMHLDISFDVNDKKDTFVASGQFKNFNAQLVNDFFKSNLNAKAEGVIEQIYFTFSGNKEKSKGDLKIKYNEFKFKILNDKNRVNKLLTALGNLFINDGSKTDNQGYRHGLIKVDRQTNKSFFNYLWINVEDGLINALTGKEK